MGIALKHTNVKLITAVMYNTKERMKSVRSELETLFGPIDDVLESYIFSFTDYYEEEMGKDFRKLIWSFKRLIAPEKLPEIKLKTNSIEDKFAHQGKRQVNIDPGYISSAKLILATTKDYIHRIYLGKGIYGDVHLKVSDASFQTNNWTYPDYKQDSVLCFFDRVRKKYLKESQGLLNSV